MLQFGNRDEPAKQVASLERVLRVFAGHYTATGHPGHSI